METIDYNLINRKTVGIDELPVPVKEYREEDQDTIRENLELKRLAFTYWDSLSDFRDRRTRSIKYYTGDQWYEEITDPDDSSTTVTEENLIKRRGKVPFKQNIIRTYIKTVLGVFSMNPNKAIVVARARDKQPEADMLSAALEYVAQFNKLDYLNLRNLEEEANSGAAIGKSMYGYIDELNRSDIRINNIDTDRFFYNTDITDPRMFGLRFIGEFHDMTITEVCSIFARSKDEEEKIKGWYSVKPNPDVLSQGLNADRANAIDFETPIEEDKCRVYEIWYIKSEWRVHYHDWAAGVEDVTDMTIEQIAEINIQRQLEAARQGIPSTDAMLIEAEERLDRFWYVKFITPNGNTLYESETPYKHKSHPYSQVFYPLLNGQAWGLVEDMIDQQRYINRLISLIDFIMGAGAKGVVFFPENLKSDDMTWEEVADEYTKFDGLIRIKTKPGVELPKQVSMNATNIGAYELLNLQLRFIQDISGISNAIQGQTPKSGTPSSLYAQQAQNSLINLKDFFESFKFYQENMANKILSLITQFYKEEKYLALAGKKFSEEARVFDPSTLEGIDFEAVIVQTQDSPLYRQVQEEFLIRLTEQGIIDGITYLENSNMPYAEKVLDSLRKRQAELQQGQLNSAGIAETQALAQQASQNTNPQAANMLNKYLNK